MRRVTYTVQIVIQSKDCGNAFMHTSQAVEEVARSLGALGVRCDIASTTLLQGPHAEVK